MNSRKITFSIIVIVFLVVGFANGQDKPTTPVKPPEAQLPFDLSSPYQSINTFLVNLQPNRFHPEVAAKTLNAPGRNDAEKEKLAIMLLRILDSKGLFIELEDLPRNPQYTDSANGGHRYVLFKELPSVFLSRYNGQWYFSQNTVDAIPRLHKEVFPMGLGKLVQMLPRGGAHKFLGLRTWQYFGLLILILIGFVVWRLLMWIISWLVRYGARRLNRKEESASVIKSIVRPISLFLVFGLIMALLPLLQLPAFWNKWLLIAIRISLPVFLMTSVYHLVDLFSGYLQRKALATENSLDDMLVPLVRKTLRVFVILSALIMVLNALDFNITALLTGLSIGGLAFALAAQDTIKNLFGSVTIFLDRPFQVGDWVVTDGVDGSVEEVGFRTTRIRTFYNSVISIPNGRLADMTVDNMGMRLYRRYKTNLAITYDTPPELIEAFTQGLRQIVMDHPDTRKDYFHVYMNNFGAASLDVLFYIFFKVPDWGEELRARHEVILQILELAKSLGIRFAFPTQTIFIEEAPGQGSLTPQYADLSEAALKAKIEDYRRKQTYKKQRI